MRRRKTSDIEREKMVAKGMELTIFFSKFFTMIDKRRDPNLHRSCELAHDKLVALMSMIESGREYKIRVSRS